MFASSPLYFCILLEDIFFDGWGDVNKWLLVCGNNFWDTFFFTGSGTVATGKFCLSQKSNDKLQGITGGAEFTTISGLVTGGGGVDVQGTELAHAERLLHSNCKSEEEAACLSHPGFVLPSELKTCLN